jgi:HK97 family phage portal protein
LEIITHDQIQDILMGDDGQHLTYVLTNGKVLHSDDVIHFMGLSVNGLSGLNTTKTHADTFASEAAMRDYVRSFLEKGAFLSGVIEHPTQLTDQAYKKAKSSWDSAFGGANKAGGTAWLEGGATYKRIQSNIVESGFEVVKASLTADASRIYGVPEYMIDGKNKPTYNGQEQGDIQFKKYTIDGWCVKIKQELSRKLIPSAQQGRLFFDYDQTGLTSGDLATMGNYYQKLFNMSILNRNEIRKMIKKNNVVDGDRYFIQGNNMLPVDKIDEMINQKSNTPDPGADMNTITE